MTIGGGESIDTKEKNNLQSHLSWGPICFDGNHSKQCHPEVPVLKTHKMCGVLLNYLGAKLLVSKMSPVQNGLSENVGCQHGAGG